MLLSDGKFQSASDKKKEILEIVFSDLYQYHNEEIVSSTFVIGDQKTKQKPKQKNKKPIPNEAVAASSQASSEEKDKILKYKNSYWTSQRLKKLLNYSGSIEDVMQWDQKTKIEHVQAALNNDSTFEGVSYSKMLIIIAGNIDEAYNMSDVSDADTDADIFHEFSKKINVVTIKHALAKRFKPEQVARFGNNHIIYPSLNKTSYKEIIKRTVFDTINRVKSINSIEIEPTESVFSTIYNNGVFPAQGVRPVHSTISSIFDNYIPIFLFRAIENGSKKITIRYTNDEIIGIVGDESISCKVELSISNIKKQVMH
jgi:cell division protease FtsH